MPRSGFETARTRTPSASSCATTSFQPELSAKAPWTSATVGREPFVLASVMVISSGTGRRNLGGTRLLPDVGDGVPQAGTLLRRPRGRIGQVTRWSTVGGRAGLGGPVGPPWPAWK